MAAKPVHSAPLPVVAAGKITACHTNPQQMQAGAKQMACLGKVNFHLWQHWVKHLQKRLLKKYHISLLILKKHLQQELNHAKCMPEWVASEILQHSPLSCWFD